MHSNQLRSSEDDIMVAGALLKGSALGMLDCQCQVVVCSAEKDTGWLFKSGSKRVVEGKIGSAEVGVCRVDTSRHLLTHSDFLLVWLPPSTHALSLARYS